MTHREWFHFPYLSLFLLISTLPIQSADKVLFAAKAVWDVTLKLIGVGVPMEIRRHHKFIQSDFPKAIPNIEVVVNQPVSFPISKPMDIALVYQQDVVPSSQSTVSVGTDVSGVISVKTDAGSICNLAKALNDHFFDNSAEERAQALQDKEELRKSILASRKGAAGSPEYWDRIDHPEKYNEYGQLITDYVYGFPNPNAKPSSFIPVTDVLATNELKKQATTITASTVVMTQQTAPVDNVSKVVVVEMPMVPVVVGQSDSDKKKIAKKSLKSTGTSRSFAGHWEKSPEHLLVEKMASPVVSEIMAIEQDNLIEKALGKGGYLDEQIGESWGNAVRTGANIAAVISPVLIPIPTAPVPIDLAAVIASQAQKRIIRYAYITVKELALSSSPSLSTTIQPPAKPQEGCGSTTPIQPMQTPGYYVPPVEKPQPHINVPAVLDNKPLINIPIEQTWKDHVHTKDKKHDNAKNDRRDTKFEKEERAERIRDRRRWTNKEAREQAEGLGKGYEEKKNKPIGIKDIAFTNGKNWISPDIDGHNGGVWKEFNLKGDRVGTLDKNLNKIKT